VTDVRAQSNTGGAGDGTDARLARVELYGVLSAIFARELTEDAWVRLSAEEAQASLLHVAAECGVEREAARLLGVAAALAAQPRVDVVEDLAVDYARVFIGPGPGLAPPYESVYTSSTRRFYGEAFSEITAVLRQEGLGVGSEFGAPADHVAVELVIMRHLAESAAPAGDAGHPIASGNYQKQLAFLDNHLLRWVPRWAEDVAREAVASFYREAAALLVAFLRRDRAWLDRAVVRAGTAE